MAGRKSRNVEAFQLTQKLLNLNVGALAKRVGKKTANVSAYLSGSKVPGERTLLSSWRHAFEWDVIPIVEVRDLEGHKASVPGYPGIYALYDSSASVLYVGQAANLKSELNQTLNRACNFPVRRGPNLSRKAKPKYKELAVYLSAYRVDSPRMRHNLEALLLRLFPNQAHNDKLGKFR